MRSILLFAGLLGSSLMFPQAGMAAGTGMDWTGFYVGVQGGYATGDAAAPYALVTGGPYTLSQSPANQSGMFGGVHIGAQQQIDKIVFGLEADVELSGVGGDDGGSGGDLNALNNNWQGSLRGRIGYAFDPVLIYGTAGVAMMNATATAPAATTDVNFTGFTLGGGVEAAVTDSLSARVEYRYTDFGSSEAAFPVNGYFENYNPKHHAVRVGISYHFD